MKVVVVYNPKSGSALPRRELKAMFDSAHVSIEAFIDITATTAPAKINRHAKHKTIIAAIGGDGTIASVAQHVINTPGILAPLPGGTLNHFTKDAGITQDLAEAIAALPHTAPRRVDVAMVNDRVFLNNSSIGVYPSSLRTRERFEDTLGKWPAAVVGSLRAFVRFRLYNITINGDEYRTPFLFVGNNDYQITQTAERTKLDAGILSVYAITSDKRRSILKLIYAALTKQLDQHDEFLSFQTTSFTIHTKRASKLNVSTDGEVNRLDTPLHYSSLPNALTIIGN